jgi:hypothetical protein
MTNLITSSLQNEIDDLTRRHTSFKQKWLEKQRNIADLLTSAVVACRTSADDIPHNDQQQTSSSDNIDDSEFERSFIDYLTKHAPISVSTLSQIFSKDDEQIYKLLKYLKFKLDTDGKIVLPVQSSNSDRLKLSSSSPIKRSLLSWMSVPTRRGLFSSRDRPPRQLVHLLSHLTARELERENFNVEMDRLLNRQTAMEKILSRKFHTNDTIQEYCQYTTRDDCPLANPHLRRRSRSSSTSSDNDQVTTDDDSQTRKKRKRNDSLDFNERSKRSSRYYRKNGRDFNTCGKVHFRSLIKSHTDKSLGDCSFLNTCFHMVIKKKLFFFLFYFFVR